MSQLPAPITKTTTDNDEDMQETAFRKRGCICFPIPCFSSETSSPSWWERIQIQSPEKNHHHQWWFRGWMKVRELSEIVAGPKWKTFIRRFGKNRNSYVKQGTLNYDPSSYALNFDDGATREDGNFYGYGGFSARYAAVPVTEKSSMDLKKEAPVIT